MHKRLKAQEDRDLAAQMLSRQTTIQAKSQFLQTRSNSNSTATQKEAI
jgi:hypothetical protein